MRETDLLRELERVTVDAHTARERLAELRGRLSEARVIVEEVRRILASEERRPSPPDVTSESGHKQEEAEAG